jgi:hypothetical protein
MSKVVYIIGAGASYGKREKDSSGKDIPGKITEGLPTVEEMSIRLRKVKELFEQYTFNKDDITENEGTNNSLTCRNRRQLLVDDLVWLIENSEKHATIDTFAKKLFLTGKTKEYTKLKRLLSVYFKVEQLITPPDSRYDSFLASVLRSNSYGKLRISEDISILTWNYDSQFEIAYLEYLSDGLYKENVEFPSDLGIDIHSNVSDFVKPFSRHDNGERQIFKLNGSAAFHTEYSMAHYYLNHHGQLDDGMIRAILEIYAAPYYKNGESKLSMMNFAWDLENEYDAKTNYKTRIESAICDAISLVVIGYRFPYFNRETDAFILSKMKNLEHIYIQDPHAGDIKESLINLLRKIDSGFSKDKILLQTNVEQFFLPSEL